MKLSVRGAAIAGAIVWAAAFLFVLIFNAIKGDYGVAFLEMMGSIYPGYAHTQGIVAWIVGLLYALVDGAICAGVFAWVYNKFADRGATAAPTGGGADF